MTRTSVVRRLTAIVVTALMLLQLVPLAAGASSVEEGAHRPAYVEGQVIVKYKDGLMAAQGASLFALQSAAELTPLATIGSTGAQVLDIGEDGDVYDVVQELEQTGLVEYAQPNFIYYTADAPERPVPNDSLWPSLWGLHNTGQEGGKKGIDIGALDAWEAVETAGHELEEIIVAVIDTGMDINHPDLQGMIWTAPWCEDHPREWDEDDAEHYTDGCHGKNFIQGQPENHISHQRDQNTHATHVAGTIAAVRNNRIGIAGVTSNVKIMAVRFMEGPENASGTTADAIAAIEWAADNGAQIANLSWGNVVREQDTMLQEAIAKSGMVFIAAAGNNNKDNDTQNMMPANAGTPNLISVAAIDRHGEKAWFSNRGITTVHLAAPGEAITSAVPKTADPKGYASMNGTSMAVPHVVGVAAAVMGQKNLGQNEVIGLLKQSGQPLESKQPFTITDKMVSMRYAVATAVGNVAVTLTNDASASTSIYTVTFKTGDYGRLVAGRDTISLTLPEAYDLRDALDQSAIKINNAPATATIAPQGRVLVLPAPNTGHGQTVTIELPLTNPAPGEYHLSVHTSTDPVSVASNIFEIGPPAPTPLEVALISPQGNVVFNGATAPNGEVTLEAATSDASGNAQVWFEQRHSDDHWETIGLATNAGESKYVLKHGFADGTYIIRANGQMPEGGNTGLSESATITVDTIAPRITVSPVVDWDTESQPPKATINIADDTTGIDWQTFQLSFNGHPKAPDSTNQGDGTVLITAPTLPEGQHTLVITVHDNAGNLAIHTENFNVTAPAGTGQNNNGNSYPGDSGGGGGGGGAPSGTATTTLTIPEPPTPHPIPPTGQTITDETTGLAITFPAQAVTAPINLTVQPVPPENQPPTNNTLVGNLIVQVEATTEQGQPVTTFQQPITITFPLPPNTTPPTTHRVFYWDPNASQWIAIPTRYDATNNTITGTTDHLTIFAVLAAPAFPRLTDIEGHWAEADILRLLSLDIVGGVGGSRFDTEGNVTRAQFARMLVRALGLVPIPDTHLTFSDADDFPEWAVFDIAAAAGATIVQGLDGNRFGPAENITREQMATMIARALGAGTSDAAGPTSFTDDASIADWARASVQAATDHGIISGIGGNTFAPKAYATRAQAARMIARMLSVRAVQQRP